jgi:hypothetical protein
MSKYYSNSTKKKSIIWNLTKKKYYSKQIQQPLMDIFYIINQCISYFLVGYILYYRCISYFLVRYILHHWCISYFLVGYYFTMLVHILFSQLDIWFFFYYLLIKNIHSVNSTWWDWITDRVQKTLLCTIDRVKNLYEDKLVLVFEIYFSPNQINKSLIDTYWWCKIILHGHSIINHQL